jgi:hypothetical protein
MFLEVANSLTLTLDNIQPFYFDERSFSVVEYFLTIDANACFAIFLPS